MKLVHSEFGNVCMCNCHKYKLDIRAHCFSGPCCELSGKKYLKTKTDPVDRESAIRAHGEDGLLDEDKYRLLCSEHGIELPYFVEKKEVGPFDKYVFPSIGKRFPRLYICTQDDEDETDWF